MSEKMSNARFQICDTLQKRYENKVSNVPIESDLTNLARKACKLYKLYLEQKRIGEKKFKKDNKKKREKELELKLKLSEKKVSFEDMGKKIKKR